MPPKLRSARPVATLVTSKTTSVSAVSPTAAATPSASRRSTRVSSTRLAGAAATRRCASVWSRNATTAARMSADSQNTIHQYVAMRAACGPPGSSTGMRPLHAAHATAATTMAARLMADPTVRR